MVVKKNIGQVRGDISLRLARTAPEVLRGKFAPQHAIWALLQDCDAVLLILITDRILKEKSILSIIEKFDEIICEMCIYLDSETQIRLAIYWMTILNMIKSMCLEEDQFEACSNIKKFMDIYFTIAENPDDED
jgi:hypothetical protein